MQQKIVGFHAISETLKTIQRGILYLCPAIERRNEQLESLARQKRGITIRKVDKNEIERLAGGAPHKGALLVIESQTPRGESLSVSDFLGRLEEGAGALVLALDGITDVNNLGAILRSADQFSVDLVIIPQRRSAQLNQAVQRISSGAAQYVPTASAVNLVRELELLQKSGFWVYGAEMGGEPLSNVKFPPRTVLVMGSEEKGLGQLTTRKCDQLVSIPTTGHIDSLNVSVATAILLYEFRRQQL